MNPVVRGALAYLSTHLLVAAAVAGGVYGVVAAEHYKHLEAMTKQLADARVVAEAEKRGAVEGKLVAALSMNAEQKTYIKDLQKIDARVRAVEQMKTTVKVEDKPTGHLDNAAAPAEWLEDRHRFGLNLKTFEFWRKQAFEVTEIVATGPAGSRIDKFEFHEKDPETGEEIPLTGVAVKTDFQFTKDAAPVVSPWHMRLAALGGTMGFGLAAQWNPWRGLLLSVGGAYKSGDPRALAGLGWRLRLPWLDSTLGLNGLVTFGKSGLRPDGAGSAEVTR